MAQIQYTSANPSVLFDLAVDLKDCILNAMAREGVELPERACVVTGDIAWDDCECGQLVVNLVDTFLTDSFPDQGIGSDTGTGGLGRQCAGHLLAATINVSMLRCSPGGGNNPHPPTCAELQEAARVSVVDAALILTSMSCCLSEWSTRTDGVKRVTDYSIDVQTFVGAQGMCQGSETNVQLAVLNTCLDCGGS